MKTIKRMGIMILALGWLVGTGAADVPLLVNYQARLLDDQGNPVSSNVTVEVAIYTNDVSGGSVYTETIGTVAVNNGIYSFNIGSAPSAGDLTSALAPPEAWLEVTVNGTPLSPRQRLVAVPYALAAGTAAAVEENAITSSMLAEGAVQSAHIEDNSITSGDILDGTIDGADLAAGAVGTAEIQDGAVTALKLAPGAGAAGPWSNSGSSVYYNGGFVGIGTDNPDATLTVNSVASGGGGGIELERDELEYADTKAQMVISRSGGGPPGLRLRMSDDDGGSYTDALFAVNSGRIGIGTTTPSEQLEVAGAIVVGDTANPTPKAGTIRWTGSAFEGYNGSEWVLLSPPPPFNIEMVTVGDAGNPDDPSSNGLIGMDTNSGAVAYTFRIGKFEVTNTEYTEFLNAVDPTGADALDLYHPNMGSSSYGGITFTGGNPEGSKYAVKAGFANKPVVYVSFYDATRFCNWLHNGAVASGDTENGAYTLLGGTAVPSNGTNVQRNAGAMFAVPTEDEWYKAAYYEPGGDADDYWRYPTRGNSAPNASSPPGTPPAANCTNAVGTVTDVGAYTTTVGFYGTYDMAGNAWEWLETTNGLSRVLRGGSWSSPSFVDLRSSNPLPFLPVNESGSLGFRVSSP